MMGMIIHSSLIAQPNTDRRQGPPPPPPREHEKGDHRGRDHRGPGPRKGEKMRPEQKEKIEMFKIQFITKNLELTSKEAEGFWPVHEAHKKINTSKSSTLTNEKLFNYQSKHKRINYRAIAKRSHAPYANGCKNIVYNCKLWCKLHRMRG